MYTFTKNLAPLFERIKKDKQLRNRLLKTIAITTTFFLVLLYFGTEAKEANFLSQAKIQAFILQYGYFSWFIYIGILVLAVMSPLPDTPIVLAGGFIFGPLVAIPLTIIGQALGATVDFYLARKLGRSYVAKKFPKAIHTLNEYSHKLGWQTVFLMRLTPTLSFDLLSYAAGLSPISYKKYILATISGMIPLLIIGSLLGYSAGLHSKIIPIAVIATGVVVITIIFFLFKKGFKK